MLRAQLLLIVSLLTVASGGIFGDGSSRVTAAASSNSGTRRPIGGDDAQWHCSIDGCESIRSTPVRLVRAQTPAAAASERVWTPKTGCVDPADLARFGADPKSKFRFPLETHGIEFRPWMRRFLKEFKHNWLRRDPVTLPTSGRVVIAFNVQRNGVITDVTVVQSSLADTYTNSARDAVLASSPAPPLPAGYPEEHICVAMPLEYSNHEVDVQGQTTMPSTIPRRVRGQ